MTCHLRIPWLAVSLVASLAVAAAAPVPTEKVPAVKGVTLTSGLSEVLLALGTPTAVSEDCEWGMDLGLFLRFDYPGLRVSLNRPATPCTRDHPGRFSVVEVVITDARWAIAPGWKVGSTKAELVRLLGAPFSSEVRDSVEILRFAPFSGDSWLFVTLKAGRVAEARLFLDQS